MPVAAAPINHPGATAQPAAAAPLVAFPTVYSIFGIQQISWQDIGIRALLIFVGVVLVVAVAWKSLSGPAVEISEAAARTGAE